MNGFELKLFFAGHRNHKRYCLNHAHRKTPAVWPKPFTHGLSIFCYQQTQVGDMRFQIASDLHLEMLYRLSGYRVIEPAPDADALILAGDIHSHTLAIEVFLDWPVPVYYVHGNHEAYSSHYYGVTVDIARKAEAAGIQYLQCNAVELLDVRILGTCLWTDYALGGDPPTAMREAQRCIRDHSVIHVGDGQDFTPAIALAEHMKSRTWLEQQLALPFDGKTIVITHYGPHRNSVHPRYAGELLNAAFVSDLTPLVEQAACGYMATYTTPLTTRLVSAA